MGQASRAKRERKLESPRSPAPAENWWKKIGAYPLIPIGVSALLTLDGPGYVGVKSWAILACAVWLCGDLWWKFQDVFQAKSEAIQRWRNVVFCLLCTIVGLLAIWPAYWLLGLHFEEEQHDVKQRLVADAITPPQMSPMDSAFTVTNPSGITIGQHNMMCYANLVTREQRMPYLTNVLVANRFFNTDLTGDEGTQTYDCLEGLLRDISRDEVGCLDVTLLFDYVLADQPDTKFTKYFRFVSTRRGDFTWQGQNTDDPREFCRSFVDERLLGSSSLSITPPALISKTGTGFYVQRPDR